MSLNILRLQWRTDIDTLWPIDKTEPWFLSVLDKFIAGGSQSAKSDDDEATRPSAILVYNEPSLRTALRAYITHDDVRTHRPVHLATMIQLTSTLELTSEHDGLELASAPGVEAGLSIDVSTFTALELNQAEHVHLHHLKIVGGVRMNGGRHNLIHSSDISNEIGANGGTCVHIASCGNATTLETCNTTVHDNNIHDCRAVNSSYEASAHGVLLGGAVAARVCTVGGVVRNNNISRVDAFGMRVSNDNCELHKQSHQNSISRDV